MYKKTVLLTGCHGLLGQYLVKLKPKDCVLVGTDHDPSSLLHGENYNYVKLDITDRNEAKKICSDVNPDHIINAAAYTDVDGCEVNKEKCWKVNVEGVENMLKCAKSVKAKFVHVSTDYIFNGDKELYSDDDLGKPLNYYGKAKLASENAVRASGPDWLLLRTSTLYDIDILKGKSNFVTWVLHNLQLGKKIRVVTDQYGNPTLARDLAKAVWSLIEMGADSVFNVAGKDVVDRYKFTIDIAKKFNLDSDLVEPIISEILDQKAKRPRKIGLDTKKYQDMTGAEVPGVDEGLSIFKSDYLSFHRHN